MTAEQEAEIGRRMLALARSERNRHNAVVGRVPDPKITKEKARVRKGTRDPKRLALIKEMVAEGFNNVEIAEAIGVSDSSVRYWRKYYNIR